MLGKHCKVYYLSDGDRESWGLVDSDTGRATDVAPADLDEIKSIKDLTLPGERDAAESSDRGADVKTEDTGAWGGRLTLTLNHRTTDDARVALEAAFITRSPIALAILNGDKDVGGVTGLWADFLVVKFEESQPEKEHVTYSVELALYDVPGATVVPPEWVECVEPTIP